MPTKFHTEDPQGLSRYTCDGVPITQVVQESGLSLHGVRQVMHR